MTTLRLRILFDGAMLGPGKAELLSRIRETGSIAAAGRQMEMSYKRAWMLVEDMNAAFQAPMVTSTRGGPGGGGAQLTGAGLRVLDLYHGIVETSQAAASAQIQALEAMLRPSTVRDTSKGKQRLPTGDAQADMFGEPYR
jgi:molybdate transport system regulatory protein